MVPVLGLGKDARRVFEGELLISIVEFAVFVINVIRKMRFWEQEMYFKIGIYGRKFRFSSFRFALLMREHDRAKRRHCARKNTT